MPRPAIFSEQLSRPEFAAALREHREDRAALLASLTASLQADPRVRAAWLWGSFGRGEADDLSDLDPWIIVTDEAAVAMGPSLRSYAQRTGNFLTGGEAPQNGPPGGGFFGSLHAGRHGLLHLDCYWQPQSAVGDVPERAVLFNRLHEPPATEILPQELRDIPEQEARILTDEEDRITGRIGFTWLMLSISAKTLARHPDSDMALMTYPRPGLEDAAALLGLGDYIVPSDWSVPQDPLDKVEVLRRLTGKTARLTEAANGRGLDLSPLFAVCLNRYLDTVEGILR